MNRQLARSIIGLAFLAAAIPEVYAQHDPRQAGVQAPVAEPEIRSTQSSYQQAGVEEPVPEPEIRGTQSSYEQSGVQEPVPEPEIRGTQI